MSAEYGMRRVCILDVRCCVLALRDASCVIRSLRVLRYEDMLCCGSNVYCDMYVIEGTCKYDGEDIGIMNMDNIGVDYMINHGCVQMM